MNTNPDHWTHLGSRCFDADDQHDFAKLSGDVNPMHMDAVAARRTQAGQPVVHGVHVVLMALEQLAASGRDLAALHRLDVAFTRFVPVGEAVACHCQVKSAERTVIEVRAGDLTLTTMKLRFGDAAVSSVKEVTKEVVKEHRTGTVDFAREPVERSLDEMLGCGGWLDAPPSESQAAALFPGLAGMLSPRMIESLALMSTVVGMQVPGLHSIFSSFSLKFDDQGIERLGLGFEVDNVDERFRMVTLAIVSSGFRGKIEAFVRQAPTTLSSRSSGLTRIPATRYASIDALVVGGSRGLGEATARAIVAGGGRVTVTWMTGSADAARVACEINDVCGAERCRTLRYDAFQPPEEQLGNHARDFTHLFYFATTQIFRQKSNAFDAALHSEFVDLYVTGFQQLCQSIFRQIPAERTLRVFYPSSIAVVDRPKGMTEYAMAKAAGEILCIDMNSLHERLDVLFDRLPRVRTDQTATVSPVESADPLELMLPLIDRLLDDQVDVEQAELEQADAVAPMLNTA